MAASHAGEGIAAVRRVSSVKPADLQQGIAAALNPRDRHNALSVAVNAFIIALILLNVLEASLQTVDTLQAAYGSLFRGLEVFSAAVFTLEFALRLWSAPVCGHYGSRRRYLLGFDGVVDVLAILPFYLSLLLGLDVRVLVALRLLRLLKLVRYFEPLNILGAAMRAEFRAIAAAMLVLFVLVFLAASGIYFFEREVQPEVFGSIPQSMWWAVVTLTTLGYGDVIPATAAGRVFASVVTVLSIGTVALPAGMLASRFSEELRKRKSDLAAEFARRSAEGGLSVEDAAALEDYRKQLCLSEDDKHRLMAGTQGRCPLCGNEVSRE